MGQNQRYRFGVGAPPSLEPILVGIGMFTAGTTWIFTHGHMAFSCSTGTSTVLSVRLNFVTFAGCQLFRSSPYTILSITSKIGPATGQRAVLSFPAEKVSATLTRLSGRSETSETTCKLLYFDPPPPPKYKRKKHHTSSPQMRDAASRGPPLAWCVHPPGLMLSRLWSRSTPWTSSGPAH